MITSAVFKEKATKYVLQRIFNNLLNPGRGWTHRNLIWIYSIINDVLIANFEEHVDHSKDTTISALQQSWSERESKSK